MAATAKLNKDVHALVLGTFEQKQTQLVKLLTQF